MILGTRSNNGPVVRPALGRVLLIALAVALWLRPEVARADLSLETETARLLQPGHYELSLAGEYQHSRDGREFALPLAIELGVLPRLELLIEPTAYVGISPRGGEGAHGLGDLEVTLTLLALQEQPDRPAIAFAGEVKFPTARSLQIGTRAYDFTPYFIMSKRFGELDVHANVSYTFLGEPPGASVKNTWTLSLGGEYKLRPGWDAIAEINSTTSGRATASNEGGGEGIGARAEVTGAELIGTVGMRHHFSSMLALFGSLSFDNAHATLVRTGFTLKF